jgi:hypothetical protein
MGDSKTSIFERLKICWYVLTKKYYLYVGLDKDSIIWDKEGKYLRIKESSVKCLVYISKDYQFLAYGKKTNLHDFALKVIAKFINKKLLNSSCDETLQEEPVSEDLEKAAKRYATEGDEISGLYIIEFEVDAFKAGAKWQFEQLMAKAVDVTIAMPYQNGDGGYSQLVDSKEALPIGENLKVLVIKQE